MPFVGQPHSAPQQELSRGYQADAKLIDTT